MIGHKKGYRLIGDCEKKYDDYLTGHTRLRRLHPDAEIPAGYTEVVSIFGGSVYDNNGVLLPGFQAIRRYNTK